MRLKTAIGLCLLGFILISVNAINSNLRRFSAHSKGQHSILRVESNATHKSRMSMEALQKAFLSYADCPSDYTGSDCKTPGDIEMIVLNEPEQQTKRSLAKATCEDYDKFNPYWLCTEDDVSNGWQWHRPSNLEWSAWTRTKLVVGTSSTGEAPSFTDGSDGTQRAAALCCRYPQFLKTPVKGYTAAKTHCEGLGRSLASVHSATSNLEAARTCGSDLSNCLIGATRDCDTSDSATWSWSDGSTSDWDNWSGEADTVCVNEQAVIARNFDDQWVSVTSAIGNTLYGLCGPRIPEFKSWRLMTDANSECLRYLQWTVPEVSLYEWSVAEGDKFEITTPCLETDAEDDSKCIDPTNSNGFASAFTTRKSKWPAAYAFDGDIETKWESAKRSTILEEGGEEYLQFEFDEATTLHGIKIWQADESVDIGCGVKQFSVQYLDDTDVDDISDDIEDNDDEDALGIWKTLWNANTLSPFVDPRETSAFSPCPVANGLECNGHGSCDYGMDEDDKYMNSVCDCDTGYYGTACSSSVTVDGPQALGTGEKLDACPAGLEANTALSSEQITMMTDGSVFITGSSSVIGEGRHDFYLTIDGDTVARSTVFGTDGKRSSGNVIYAGQLSQGEHTVELIGRDAEVWGCSSGWGGINVIQMDGFDNALTVAEHSPDERSGCHATHDKSEPLMEQEIHMGNDGSALITASIVRYAAGRKDLKMEINGVEVAFGTTYTEDTQWDAGELIWAGNLDAGKHLVQVYGMDDDVWGCASPWGAINSVRFSNPDQAFSVLDERKGCPNSIHPESQALVESTFELNESTTVFIDAQLPRYANNEQDLTLQIDNKLVKSQRSYTPSFQWKTGKVTWAGELSKGTHTVQVYGKTEGVWGCGDKWGSLNIVRFDMSPTTNTVRVNVALGADATPATDATDDLESSCSTHTELVLDLGETFDIDGVSTISNSEVSVAIASEMSDFNEIVPYCGGNGAAVKGDGSVISCGHTGQYVKFTSSSGGAMKLCEVRLWAEVDTPQSKHFWHFSDLVDVQTGGEGELFGSAEIVASTKTLDISEPTDKKVSGSYFATDLKYTLEEKTFEVWVKPNDLAQTDAGIITVQNEDGDGSSYDGIIFGAPGAAAQWTAGSNGNLRSTVPTPGGALVTETDVKAWVHIMIVWANEDDEAKITIYRNGEAYGESYTKGSLQEFMSSNSQIVFGVKYGNEKSVAGQFEGSIDYALIYGEALSFPEVKACYQRKDRRMIEVLSTRRLAEDDEAEVEEDSEGNIIKVMDNDWTEDDPLMYISEIIQPENGKVTYADDTRTILSYKPNADFNGLDMFFYEVISGERTDRGLVEVTVDPVNDVPIATDDKYSFDEDSGSHKLPLLLNDNDIKDGDTLWVIKVGEPSNGGTAKLLPKKKGIRYTSAKNFVGDETVEYTIGDGHGGNAIATATVTVKPVNDVCVAVDDVFQVDEDVVGAKVSVLENDEDVEFDELEILSVGSPSAGGSVSISGDGSFLRYSPAKNFNGEETFTYVMREKQLDGEDDKSIATVTMKVQAINDKPECNDYTVIIYEDTEQASYDVAGHAVDVDDNDVVKLLRVSGSPDAGGTASVGEDGGLLYKPAENYSGDETVSYVIQDSNGGTALCEGVFTVQPVNDIPLTTHDSITIDEDSGTSTIKVLDNDDDVEKSVLTVVGIGKTDNGGVVKISSDKESILYTPAEHYFGKEIFTYTASDGEDTKEEQVSITINSVNDHPIANSDSYTIDEDVETDFDVIKNDIDYDAADVLTILNVSECKNGGTAEIDKASNVITFTPKEHYSGEDSFTYKIGDGHGATAEASVSVTIGAVNDKPIATKDSYKLDEDSAPKVMKILANDIDYDDDDLSVVSVGVTLSGATLDLDKEAGTVTYTPASNYNGMDSFNYIITDLEEGHDTATDGEVVDADASSNTHYAQGTVIIYVVPVSDPPEALDDSAVDATGAVENVAYETQEDASKPLEMTVMDNDLEVDGERLTLVSTPPYSDNKGSLSYDTRLGRVYYEAPDNFFGTDSFTYTVTDATGITSTGRVTVQVDSVNDPPVGTEDKAEVAEDGGEITINVLENDRDVESSIDELTISKVTQGSEGGSVKISANQKMILYKPRMHFAGVDSFTYTISDGEDASDPVQVLVSVEAVNDVPVAVADFYNTYEDADMATFSVLVNDTDVDGDDLKIVAVTQGDNGGTVKINADEKQIDYKPAANFEGTESFTYTLTDAEGVQASATVKMNVKRINDNPVAQDDTFTVAEDSTTTFSLLDNDSDVDFGDVLKIGGVTDGDKEGTVSISNDDLSVIYTPAQDFYGEEVFYYTVFDRDGGTDKAKVTVTVTSVNDNVEPYDDMKRVEEDSKNNKIWVLKNDLDVDEEDTLKVVPYDSASNPAVSKEGGTLKVGGYSKRNHILYTPPRDFSGTDYFTYKVTDNKGSTAVGNVEVIVTSLNDVPEPVDDTFAWHEDGGEVEIPVLDNDEDLEDHDLTVVDLSKPDAGGAVAIAEGAKYVNYEPAPNFQGTESFKYQVSDSNGGFAWATVRVTVAPTNDVPTAEADVFTVPEDSVSNRLDVLRNDQDRDNGDRLTLVSASASDYDGTVSVSSDKSAILFSPAKDFDGIDYFSYTATDQSGGVTQGKVQVNLVPSNDAPQSVADSYDLYENSARVYLSVLDNDIDVDSDLTIAVFSQPTAGTISLDASKKKLIFTSPRDFIGTVSFTYKATDGQYKTADSTVTINLSKKPIDCQGEWTPYSQCKSVNGCTRNQEEAGERVRVFVVDVPAQHGGKECEEEDGQMQSKPCEEVPCVAPCIGSWSEWSTCSATECGDIGKKSRTFTVATPATNGGDTCEAAHNEVQEMICAAPVCAVDCVGSWSDWDEVCSIQMCGQSGVVTRTYTQETFVSGGGKPCPVEDGTVQSKKCTNDPCPVNCKGRWGRWSQCSTPTCGETGEQERVFRVKRKARWGGEECQFAHKEVQIQPCTNDPCPVNCEGEWSDWGLCEGSCEPGAAPRHHKRVYAHIVPEQYGGTPCEFEAGAVQEEECNDACPGDCVGSWSDWQDCSQTQCGNLTGIQRREYLIQSAAQPGGNECPFPSFHVDERVCYSDLCPVDCVGEYGDWGECQGRCGGNVGTQNRFYNILTENIAGGATCGYDDGHTETRACMTEACPEPVSITLKIFTALSDQDWEEPSRQDVLAQSVAEALVHFNIEEDDVIVYDVRASDGDPIIEDSSSDGDDVVSSDNGAAFLEISGYLPEDLHLHTSGLPTLPSKDGDGSGSGSDAPDDDDDDDDDDDEVEYEAAVDQFGHATSANPQDVNAGRQPLGRARYLRHEYNPKNARRPDWVTAEYEEAEVRTLDDTYMPKYGPYVYIDVTINVAAALFENLEEYMHNGTFPHDLAQGLKDIQTKAMEEAKDDPDELELVYASRINSMEKDIKLIQVNGVPIMDVEAAAAGISHEVDDLASDVGKKVQEMQRMLSDSTESFSSMTDDLSQLNARVDALAHIASLEDDYNTDDSDSGSSSSVPTGLGFSDLPPVLPPQATQGDATYGYNSDSKPVAPPPNTEALRTGSGSGDGVGEGGIPIELMDRAVKMVETTLDTSNQQETGNTIADELHQEIALGALEQSAEESRRNNVTINYEKEHTKLVQEDSVGFLQSHGSGSQSVKINRSRLKNTQQQKAASTPGFFDPRTLYAARQASVQKPGLNSKYEEKAHKATPSQPHFMAVPRA